MCVSLCDVLQVPCTSWEVFLQKHEIELESYQATKSTYLFKENTRGRETS